jgi:hypothetical protein
MKDFLGFSGGKRLNHNPIVSRDDNIFKDANSKGKLTVCVSCGGWEGGRAVEAETTQSQKHA